LPARRIALACLTPAVDTDELGDARLPSFGIRRIQAAVVADAPPGQVVRLIDLGREDVAAYVEQILAFDPDLLGFSIYVWSTDCLVAVAREVKRCSTSIFTATRTPIWTRSSRATGRPSFATSRACRN
jgi:hypothetical protein